MADDVAAALDALAPSATTLVGMSLGGLTAVATLDRHPHVARALTLVDVTPGVDGHKAGAIVAFVSGPKQFESFDAIVERTVAHNPTRSRSSLVRGVHHNARPNTDGTWSWRYDRLFSDRPATDPPPVEGIAEGLWDAIGGLSHPLLLARGSLSPVVDQADIARLAEVRPDAEVVVVDGAGHSIQGDRPLELAALLDGFHRRCAPT
jgi:pimeloyl-ACP methyl ester carboxylesterase